MAMFSSFFVCLPGRVIMANNLAIKSEYPDSTVLETRSQDRQLEIATSDGPISVPTHFWISAGDPLKKIYMPYVSVSIRMHWRHSSQFANGTARIHTYVYVIYIYNHIYICTCLGKRS